MCAVGQPGEMLKRIKTLEQLAQRLRDRLGGRAGWRAILDGATRAGEEATAISDEMTRKEEDGSGENSVTLGLVLVLGMVSLPNREMISCF